MAGVLQDVEPRFWAAITMEPNCGCWLWMAGTTRGYGVISHNRKKKYAHRLAHELFKGPIPNGYQIDHLCRVIACVNPAHLEAVSPKTNVLRSEAPTAKFARRTHCERGHPLSGKNLLTYAGVRVCRTCKIEREFRGRRRRALAPIGVANKSKTHCPQGHPYNEENTAFVKCSWGYRRRCKICHLAGEKARRKRQGEG